MKYNLNFSPIITDDIKEVELLDGQLIFDISSNSIYVDIGEQRLSILDYNSIKTEVAKMKKSVDSNNKNMNSLTLA